MDGIGVDGTVSSAIDESTPAERGEPDPNAGTSTGDGDGEGDGGCFLTTAVTAMRGEHDDGQTLTTLRRFRDEHMLTNPRGRTLVREHYAIAPKVVAQIPSDDSAWTWIADEIDSTRVAPQSAIGGDLRGHDGVLPLVLCAILPLSP